MPRRRTVDEESELGAASDDEAPAVQPAAEPPAAEPPAEEPPAAEPAALPAVQSGDSTMVRGRYDPRAIARKMNAIVEDLNEEGKLDDQQYLALQNCARDVFNFPMPQRQVVHVGDAGLQELLAQITQRQEERDRDAAIRAVEQQQRAEERAQRDQERAQREQERSEYCVRMMY